MPRAKKTTRKKTTRKKATKKNVAGNWRGIEDRFFTKVRNGFKRILSPPKQYGLRAGAVAQLGEHHTCTVGVAGSNPVSSTIIFCMELVTDYV